MFYSRVPLLLILFAFCSVTNGHTQSISMGKADTDCQDSIESCKKPVKYISDQDGCYTFACQYGTPKVHTIRTKETASIRTLMKLSRETEEENPPKHPQTVPQVEPPKMILQSSDCR
jgi:hypothetical protein